MNDLYLLARIAGSDVAIDTRQVESVVSAGETISVPAAPRQIAGLFALRSRVVTLIDCSWTVSGTTAPIEAGTNVVISSIGGHVYGFLAERVEDVVAIAPDRIGPPGGVAPGWADVVCGIATLDDRALLVISLEKFVHAPERIAA